MTNRQITLTIVLTLCSALNMPAQQPAPRASQTEQAPCERYKMRVIQPDERLDAKAVIAPPTTGVEYKGIVIDPCAQADTKRVAAPPRVTSKRKPLPLLKLNPEPENKLLTPAESMKKFSLPTAPKPKP